MTWSSVLTCLLFVTALQGADSKDTKEGQWPDLPSEGFVRGRAAKEADVEAGDAAFVMKSGDEYIGEPLKLDIPQYAVHKDAETGAKTAGILIQAEAAGGQKIAGLSILGSEEFLVGELSEFKLLGVKKPKSPPPRTAEQ